MYNRNEYTAYNPLLSDYIKEDEKEETKKVESNP